MDEREQICTSLTKWLETCSPDAPHSTPEELSDGVAIAQALANIAPSFFTQTWLGKIKADDLSNWRLKVTNLKKILKGILEYNLEVLGITMQGFQMPDVSAIGEHASVEELGRLLQLVLNVAINCEDKHQHIQGIMSMEEDVQQTIKGAIQELMTVDKVHGEDGESELQEQLKKTVDELNAALEAKEEFLHRCHELDAQVAILQEERQSLAADNEKLLERLQQAESMDDPSTPAGKRCAQLQHQIESLQEEIYKIESGRDDYRIKYEVLNKDLNELRDKNSELSKLASESQTMRDELDILRHSSDQVAKLETTIESYKKKMDDLSDLKGQMKMLEEKNTKYMQQQIEMEEECKRVVSLKQQLESYKRQTLEVQHKAGEETKRADKAEFEYKRVTEKLATVTREKERVQTERDSLRELNEELKCTTAMNSPGRAMDSELDSADSREASMEMLSLAPEIKEKLLRLEHDNKLLRMRSSAGQEEGTAASQEMLDEANARRNELETEVRLLNQRLLEVQAELEDVHESQETTSTSYSTEVMAMRTKMIEATQKREETQLQLHQKQQHIDELTIKATESADRIVDMADTLGRKEEDIRVMEEKYTRYLEKAKNVIKMMDPRSGHDSSTEVFALKNQLTEKDTYINFLEKDQEKMKSVRDNEEKLIVTAWYNLGMQLHRQAAEERLANCSMGQSFLARQRQVHSQRRSNSNMHASPSPR